MNIEILNENTINIEIYDSSNISMSLDIENDLKNLFLEDNNINVNLSSNCNISNSIIEEQNIIKPKINVIEVEPPSVIDGGHLI